MRKVKFMVYLQQELQQWMEQIKEQMKKISERMRELNHYKINYLQTQINDA